MKKRILIVDDYDEIRELIAFVLDSNIPCEVTQFSSGNQAIAHLKTDVRFDLIITDFNMPDGNGLEIFKYLQNARLAIPLAFLSGDQLDHHPALQGKFGSHLAAIPKPFTDEQVLQTAQLLLSQSAENANPQQPTDNGDFIAVRLQLLDLIHEISTPLFVRINDHKYVQLTREDSVFNEQTLKKYEHKHITHLYIESHSAQDFIAEFKKRALSDLAWDESNKKKGHQIIKLNTELLRDLTSKLGWSETLLDLAADHISRSLQIASTHPQLNHVLTQFHKIERYGYADHSSLMVLVTCGLAFQMNLNEDATLRKLTFASLIHDMQLTDDEFEHQNKLVKALIQGKNSSSRDAKNVLAHATKAAELCRHWNFCPGVVDTIIFQHHETPDGRGFPMGRKTQELHPLSCLFIVALDFVDYFVESFGEPDLARFIKTRTPIYYEPQFKVPFEALLGSLKSSAVQTAS